MIDGPALCAKDCSGGDSRGYQKSRNPNSEPGEVEVPLPDGIIRRRCAPRRSHMVILSTVFVIDDESKCVVPTFAVVQRVIDIVDQLLAQRYVVVGVLTISARAEIRLQKSVGGQCACRSSALEVTEMSEMAFVRILRVRVIQPGHRIPVVSVDCPVDVAIRQAAKDTRTGKNLDLVVEVALRCGSGGKGAVGYGLRRSRREPLIANGETFCQSGHDR